MKQVTSADSQNNTSDVMLRLNIQKALTDKQTNDLKGAEKDRKKKHIAPLDPKPHR
jgi:hypothetical protein